MRIIKIILFLSFWVGILSNAVAEKGFIKYPGSDFDYLVLSLSWSPQFCSDRKNRSKNPKQCDIKSSQQNNKHGFVVHGLWPQFRNGGYPSFCSRKGLEPEVIVKYQYLFPSNKLMIHQWNKHGSCYSKNPDDYFMAIDKLNSIVEKIIPLDYFNLEKSFKDSKSSLIDKFKIQAKTNNLSFESGNFSIYCSRNHRFLREVRICFNTNLSPSQCDPKLVKTSKKSCADRTFIVRSF